VNATGRARRTSLLSRLKREDGQAAWEFLLVLPVFVLWMLLVVDFGILMYEYVSVSNGVREGARHAAVNCGDGDCTAQEVLTRAAERAGGILDPANCDGEVFVQWVNNAGTLTSGNKDKGDSVVVRVDHDYDFLFFPATISVVSRADMRLERADLGSVPAGETTCT
jgi:Flp pilus assembly protein TadG